MFIDVVGAPRAIAVVLAVLTATPAPAVADGASAGAKSGKGKGAEPAGAKREVADRIVAVIEDEIITMRELDAKAAPYLNQLDSIKDPAEHEAKARELYRQVLDIEIGDKMVARELDANREKLGVTDQEVDRAIEQVQRDSRYTREQLQAALYGQGMTWAEYRKKLREQLERARLIQYRVQGKVQLKDEDVRHRCESESRQAGSQICASHILLAVPAGATAEQEEEIRRRAVRLQAEVANGADFAAYALKHSDDKQAPDGRIGCFGKGEMVESFESAAFALQVGGISAVVRTPLGFHIIKVTDKRAAPSGACTDENTLNGIRNQLYQEEMERQMNLWIQELRQKSFVEVRL